MRYLLPLLMLTAGPALAFPGHGAESGSFAMGLAHPLLGLDYLIAMAAIGIVATLMAGRARWAVPLAFLGLGRGDGHGAQCGRARRCHVGPDLRGRS